MTCIQTDRQTNKYAICSHSPSDSRSKTSSSARTSYVLQSNFLSFVNIDLMERERDGLERGKSVEDRCRETERDIWVREGRGVSVPDGGGAFP